MTEQLLVNANGAAGMLGIGRSLLYQMASDGRLGPMPIAFGRKTLYRVEELRAWTAANCPPRNLWLKQREGGRS